MVEPAGERGGAFGSAAVDGAVGPAVDERLDEALRFAVGARTVGAREEVTDAELAAGERVRVGAIAGAVVGEDALDLDPERGEPGDCTTQEAGGGLAPFVRQDLGIGEPCCVVNRDVDELPAELAARTSGAPSVLAAAVADHAVPGARDPSQPLRVEVDELTGALAFVAVRRLRRYQARALTESDPPQHRRDGRERHPEHLGDLGRGHEQFAQLRDRVDPIGRRAVRNRLRRRAAVKQTRLALLAPALQPAVGRPLANAGGLGRRRQRPALALDPLNEQLPTLRTGAGVTVQLHPVSSLGLVASAPLSLQGDPDVLLTKVLRNYT